MGIHSSPAHAQEIMESIFADMDDVENYIDDIDIFSLTFEDHMKTLDEVLYRLEKNNFTVNPLKCLFAIKETDWLGYWLTPTGLKPWGKKIQGIQSLATPTNVREIRRFVGLVNFYRTMWPRRAHLLAPLTAITGKEKKFIWTPEHQEAFERMKSCIRCYFILS